MKRVFSGIQPSGDVHVGNYVGAISRWVEQQHEAVSVIFIADLHAITVPQDPDLLRENTLKLAKLLVACGIQPDGESILFKQSDVAAHSELAWILNCIAYMGELSRMTQYKDKSQKQGKDVSSVGLFDYPVLQAADILLYDTDEVPVGQDQKQHIELTRDLAERFNKRFGKTFTVPEPKIVKNTARIMSLTDPARKMSKSDPEGSYIALLDAPDVIEAKIRKAVTTEQGLTNLYEIYCVFSGNKLEYVKAKYAGHNEAFKQELTSVLSKELGAIADAYYNISDDEAAKILAGGAQKASEIANAKLEQVRKSVGLA